MDRYVKSINQGPGSAPAAGNPSMGGGNVPFAPGVISGQTGNYANQTPLARQTVNPMQSQPPPQAPPPPAPQGAVPAPGAAPQQGMGQPMGQANPAAWTAFYLQFLDSFLAAIKESANKPLIGGMY